MSAAPRLLAAAPRSVLRGGCAPGECQKGLQRLRESSAGLERLCAWLENGLPDEPPRMRPRPLLGDCLSELVGELSNETDLLPEREEGGSGSRLPSRRGVSPAFPQSKAHKPTKPRVPHPEGRQVMEKSTFRSDPAPARKPKGGASGASSGKADRALLERLAGASDRRATASGSQPHSGRAAGKPAWAPLPGAAPRSDGAASLHSQPETDGGHAPWVRRAARRARGVLDAPSVWTAQPAFSDQAIPLGEAGLEEQWSWPLSGETIPVERIEALTGVIRRDALPESGRRSGTPGNHEPGTRPLDRALQDSLPPARSGQERYAPSPEEAGLPPASETAQALAGTPHDPGESLAGPAPRFAPPQVAATLPSLRPVQWSSVELTPAAAFTAERSARREAADTEPDDLDELALKLRRILEEEARRHGIEV